MDIPYYTTAEVNKLPDQPGIYKYYNKTGNLIYVGKAKNIKKRVGSYFTKIKNVDRKTRKMVSEIERIEFTIVNSEFDALLLENNLIKNNQPKYNINLKDDKTYPYLCITNERFPRIFATRKKIPKFGSYFGPFASVKAMNNVLELVRNLYTLRTCKFNLSKENIAQKKFKVCLEYHIGNCKGPCEGLQEEEEYNHDIGLVANILKGNMNMVRNHFKEKMMEAAANMEFEKAQRFKEKLLSLEKFQSRSLVVNEKIDNVDVFSIVADEKTAFINYLKIKDGTIIITKTVEVKKKLDESNEDILSIVMIELLERFGFEAVELLSNIEIPANLGVEVTVPKIGDKRKLIDLSIKNALFYKKERLNSIQLNKQQENRVLLTLQKDLQLKNIPKHIECFDNSNIQGTSPVASMVCFRKGKPSKKEYRHYHIKTVVGPDDFASMAEVTYRRYKRQLEENAPLPDLIVVDGGKGQLSAACESLKSLDLYGKVPIVGIAKRLEEIFYPGDSAPLYIDKKSETLKILQNARNEAHRFGINHHRNKRSKNTFKTELTDIPGIGKATAQELLQKFQSVTRIKKASLAEISAVIGPSKAQSVRTWFNLDKA